jgi:molybdopterin-guanine dinucleotide biosynthesis protein A
MIRRRDMILIGAAARKTGKTAYACRIIARESKVRDVFGLKITPWPGDAHEPLIDDADRRAFRIVEETNFSPSTDTGRMLAAGARRAFRLLADREQMTAGIQSLLQAVPEPACLVAEGNSARRAVEPGLFILLKDPRGEEKDSYRELASRADRIAESHGGEWVPTPEECLFLDGEWMLKPRASAVILAGGDSRRMGRDKSLLPVAGRPLIAHIADRLRGLFDDIVIGGGRPGDYDFLGLGVVSDRIAGQGPLMGIASALERTKNDLAFVIGCDIPDFDRGFIARLADKAEGYDAVLPANARGELEPVFAYYRKSVIEPAETILAAGGRSILDLLPHVRTRTVRLPEGVEIRNINTEEDYRKLVDGGF